jgi:hypothetical protein
VRHAEPDVPHHFEPEPQRHFEPEQRHHYEPEHRPEPAPGNDRDWQAERREPATESSVPDVTGDERQTS